MTSFEFLFGLFGLLLGFILIEVLGGLMRTLRARLPSGPGVKAEVHVGWLTPLLGAFTMLNVLVWWGNVWGMQDVLPIGYDTMTLGLILCSFYYFAASMIFPDNPRAWPDVDDWFWLHRRQVLGCILAANSPLFLWGFVQGGTSNELIVHSVVVALTISLLLLATFANKISIVTASLAILIAIHLSFIPLDYLHRQGIW